MGVPIDLSTVQLDDDYLCFGCGKTIQYNTVGLIYNSKGVVPLSSESEYYSEVFCSADCFVNYHIKQSGN